MVSATARCAMFPSQELARHGRAVALSTAERLQTPLMAAASGTIVTWSPVEPNDFPSAESLCHSNNSKAVEAEPRAVHLVPFGTFRLLKGTST